MKCFVWNFVFHKKKLKLVNFLQKGKLLPEKQVIFSALVFLPTESILNYSAFLYEPMQVLFECWEKLLHRITFSDNLCNKNKKFETWSQETEVVLPV